MGWDEIKDKKTRCDFCMCLHFQDCIQNLISGKVGTCKRSSNMNQLMSQSSFIPNPVGDCLNSALICSLVISPTPGKGKTNQIFETNADNVKLSLV